MHLPDVQCSLRTQIGFKVVKGMFGVKGTADHRLGSQETLEVLFQKGRK